MSFIWSVVKRIFNLYRSNVVLLSFSLTDRVNSVSCCCCSCCFCKLALQSLQRSSSTTVSPSDESNCNGGRFNNTFEEICCCNYYAIGELEKRNKMSLTVAQMLYFTYNHDLREA